MILMDRRLNCGEIAQCQYQETVSIVLPVLFKCSTKVPKVLLMTDISR